jgi:hypothetical protein
MRPSGIKVLLDVIRDAFRPRHDRKRARRCDQDRIAVRSAREIRLRRGQAAAARMIFDEHRLGEHTGERLGRKTRGDVRRTSGIGSDKHSDRAQWIFRAAREPNGPENEKHSEKCKCGEPAAVPFHQ